VKIGVCIYENSNVYVEFPHGSLHRGIGRSHTTKLSKITSPNVVVLVLRVPGSVPTVATSIEIENNTKPVKIMITSYLKMGAQQVLETLCLSNIFLRIMLGSVA